MLLEELNLKYDDCYNAKSKNGQLKIYSSVQKRNYFYDFCYNDKIIEFNGDFWHCNPNTYNESDKNQLNNITAKDIWNKDANKISVAEQNGYKVLTIWESEYEKDLPNTLKKCKDFILS